MTVTRGDVDRMIVGIEPWREAELHRAQGFISQQLERCERTIPRVNLRVLERAEADLARLPEDPRNDDLRDRIERLVPFAYPEERERPGSPLADGG